MTKSMEWNEIILSKCVMKWAYNAMILSLVCQNLKRSDQLVYDLCSICAFMSKRKCVMVGMRYVKF